MEEPSPEAMAADAATDGLALAARPGEWARVASLRDRTPVLLRSIRPSDRDRLEAGLRALSPATRLLRFHRPIERLSAADLDHLTEVDHVDHEAIVALDLGRPERPGIGVARYQRDDRDPRVAELAITVDDRYQGQGAGGLLIAALVERARAAGIERFRGEVLEGNRRALDMFDRFGAIRAFDGTRWVVDWPLPPAHPTLLERALEMLTAAPHPVGRARRRAAGRDQTRLPAALGAELADLHDELDAWLEQRETR